MKHENKPNGETDGNTLKKQQFCNARSKKSYTSILYTETQISTQGAMDQTMDGALGVLNLAGFIRTSGRSYE